MDIKVIDKSGQQLTNAQVESLNIWNKTMAHVCATVLDRIQKENNTKPTLVDKTKST